MGSMMNERSFSSGDRVRIAAGVGSNREKGIGLEGKLSGHAVDEVVADRKDNGNGDVVENADRIIAEMRLRVPEE